MGGRKVRVSGCTIKSVTTPKRPRGRPPTGQTPKRYFRAPDELWNPAIAKAHAEHTNLTAVLNEALRKYLKTKPRGTQ